MTAAPTLRNRKKMNVGTSRRMIQTRLMSSTSLPQARRNLFIIFVSFIVIYHYYVNNRYFGTSSSTTSGANASLRGRSPESSVFGTNHNVWVTPNSQPFVSHKMKSMEFFLLLLVYYLLHVVIRGA